jgi:hypothetical protein
MEKQAYKLIAELITAIENCKRSNNVEWLDKHSERLDAITDAVLPSGSGFDSGCTLDLEASTREKIVVKTSFHHLTEGMYNGWTNHTVTVKPSFIDGFSIGVTGPNRNQIKEYIHEVFSNEFASVVHVADDNTVSKRLY